MKKPITIGTKVQFDSNEGPQHGRVADIKSHIGNGQRIALVDVPGTMNGRPWELPITDLKAAA